MGAEFLWNFFCFCGIFFFGWVVPAQGRARPGFWNGGTQGTAFWRAFATVCALRGPFLVVLRDPLVRVETTLAHQH